MFTVISGYHVILELSRVKIHPRVWPVHVPQVDGAVSAVGELIESYGVSYHQFADDTQLLVSMDSTNATPAIDRLAHCSAAVRLWFLQNGLQLNADKSAPLPSSGQLPTSPSSTLLKALCRSHRNSSRLAWPLIPTCGSTVTRETLQRPATSTLALCATCAVYWPTTSSIASRLDYCNALLSGAPAMTFDKLQRTQNNLARVVCQSRGTYKLAVLTHKLRTTATPTYLSELVQTRAPPRTLRSSDASMLIVPRVHTKLARRAFSVAAPSTWNSLPADIRLCENIPTFKRHLKTHLFKLT